LKTYAPYAAVSAKLQQSNPIFFTRWSHFKRRVLSLKRNKNSPKREKKMTDFTSTDFLVTLILAAIAVFGVLRSRAQVQRKSL